MERKREKDKDNKCVGGEEGEKERDEGREK